jgi:hypothetical protein
MQDKSRFTGNHLDLLVRRNFGPEAGRVAVRNSFVDPDFFC